MPHVPLTSLLIYHHRNEQLVADFIFVIGYIFLVTTSFNIKFISIVNMQGHGETDAANSLRTAISAFTAQKIIIEAIVSNNKFKAVH